MEPNTEQLFATQEIEEEPEDELVQQSLLDFSDDDDVNDTTTTDEEMSTEIEAETEKEKRRQIVSQLDDSAFLQVKYTQDILKRFQKVEYDYPPPSQRRVMTQEEIDDNEMIRRTYTSNIRDDMVDMFYVNEKIPTAKDETLPEVKKLVMTKGFISARQVHNIVSQSQAIEKVNEESFEESEIEIGVCTQLEKQEKEKQLKKCFFLDDEGDHLDKEVLDEINKQQLLNNSLGTLSQKLSNSRRGAEIIESSLSQSHIGKDIDLDVTYLEDSMSEDEDKPHVVYTEEMEFDFLSGTEVIDDSICWPKLERNDEVIPFILDLATQSSNFSVPSPVSIKPKMSSKTKLFEEEVKKLAEFDPHESQSTQDIMFGFNNLPSTSKITAPPVLPGFGFVSGRNVEIKNMEGVKARFEIEDQANLSELRKEFINTEEEAADFEESPAPLKQFKIPGMLASPAITTSNAKRSLNLVNHNDSFSTPESTKSMKRLNKFLVPSPSFSPITSSLAIPMPSTSGFVKAGGKNEIAISSEKLKKIQKLFEEEDQLIFEEAIDNVESPVKPIFKKLKLDFGNSPVASSSPFLDSFKKGIAQHSTPLASRFRNKPPAASHEISSVVPLCLIPEDESLQMFEEIGEPTKKTLAKTCLIDKFNNSVESNTSMIDFDELDSIALLHQTKFQVEENIKAERERALEDQKRLVAEKADVDRAPMAGTVYMKKNSKNRLKLREYVEQLQPKKLDRHFITFNSAVDYKFTMQNHYDEEVCRTNSTGITIADNARLIFNSQSKVGVDEITWSFLASPGVDSKLVSERWIENAFKMIVLKLSHLENSFEKFNKYELLNPENVLLQMKYRYDREIDKTNRSAIRKLTERDDVSCRRMVLQVVDIIEVSNLGYELQLSDGWYSIRASIDASLANAVESKKIIFGTKLVISCADLIGCEASDPLELLENVRLKIHANSTRKTTWDAKMGFCKNPTQIQVPLDSVLATGGVIGKIVVAVVHVYPTVYVDHTGPTKESRSEKLQHRIENKRDVLNFAMYEAISHQVQEEESKEIKDRVLELKASKKKLEVLNAEEICDLLAFETDEQESVLIQKQLSSKLLEEVQSIRDERNFKIKEEIMKKLGEKSQRPPPVIRVRVVDAVKMKETAIVSCWSPSEDLVDILKDGATIEIFNSLAGPRTNEIQVTVGRSSAVRLAKMKVPEEKLQPFFRQETKLSDINSNFKPLNNEFDSAFVVIQVDPFNEKESQKVFVADEDMNILCIVFWNGISAAAFDDVMTVGQIVYARNLQWRMAHVGDIFPKAFVIDDVTLFLIRPMKQSHQRRLIELKSSVGDISSFIDKCKDKMSDVQHSSTTNKENQSYNKKKSPNKSTNSVEASLVKSFTDNSSSMNSSSNSLQSSRVVPKKDSITRAREKRSRRLGSFNNFSNKFNHPTSTEGVEYKKVKFIDK